MARAKDRVSKQNASNIRGSAAEEAPADSSSPDTSRQPNEPSAEARARLGQIRSRLETAVGQLILLMMHAPRYRHQSLADLNHLLIEPLLRDRIAIAHAKEAGDPSGRPAPVGAAIWASVDEAGDGKIREQIKAGTFPVRLSGEEWNSGDTIWLLDIIAANRRSANAVLLNFRALAADRIVQLHPAVARCVDAELLDRLKVPI